MNSREADPRNFTLEQWQQAKRMGVHGRDLKETVRECWAVSDNRQSFAQALEARGMTLARGDRRGHVAVTWQGEVLSIARYTGQKTKAVRERLGAPDDLPDVDAARAAFARDMRAAFQRHAAEAQERKRRALEPYERRRLAIAESHRAERIRLDAAQKERWAQETKERSARLHKGMKGRWQAVTGERRQIEAENTKAAYRGLARDRDQRQALVSAQLDERQALQREISGVRRDHAALLRDLRRDRPKREHQEQAAPRSNDTPPHAERLTRLRDGVGRENRDRGRESPERDR